MSDHISPVSDSCFLFIHGRRRIGNTVDFSTVCIIATSLIHSKLDYCNSLFFNFPQSQIGRLQFIINALARAVSKTLNFAHISPVLTYFHWLKIEQRFQYKVAVTKFFNQNNLLISIAFSLFNLEMTHGG